MTDLRQAAQQALEAMRCAVPTGKITLTDWYKSITALRAALAEPVQEPVAWIQPDHLQKARKAPFLCRVEPTKRMVDFVPLYAVPPQRKPLTEEEIAALTKSYPASSMWQLIVSTARAIERAHGIV